MAGENFNLDDDNAILGINSPRNSVGGPFKIVYKNTDERWAIVALDWMGTPSLGIRWFWGGNGNPSSNSYPTWLIIPSALIISILNGLPLDYNFRSKLEKYLAGEITGEKI